MLQVSPRLARGVVFWRERPGTCRWRSLGQARREIVGGAPPPASSAVRGGEDGGSLPPHLTHEGGVEGHGGCGSPRSGCKGCLPTRFDRALLTAYRRWSAAACPI